MPPATVTEEKAALRREIRSLPRPDWAPLLKKFLELPALERAETVLAFYGVGREPDTAPLLEELLRRGKRVCLPRCLPGRRMEARQVPALDGLRRSAYDIPEPGDECPAVPKEELDLILVPNLCCDRAGYRLGQGGGYYDRYLSGCAAFTAALCPDSLLRERLPREPFDRPVDVVLTETQSRITRLF